MAKKKQTASTNTSAALPANEFASPEVLLQFFELAPVAFIAVDEKGIIRFVNQQAGNLLGYGPEELLYRHFEMLIPERYRENHTRYQQTFFTQPQVRSMGSGLNIVCLRRDGVELTVDVGLNPIQLPGGNFVLASISDMSERLQSELKLQVAETQYRLLAEQIPPIVYISGRDEGVGVTYISPRIQILGFTQEEWVADKELWLRQMHPDDRERVLAEIANALEKRIPFHCEYRIFSKDGQMYWFLDEAFDIRDPNGVLMRHQGFMLDITDRKKAEQALAEREHFLEKLAEMTRAILSAQDFESTLHTLAINMKDLIGADACSITLCDEERQLVKIVATTAVPDFQYLHQTWDNSRANLTFSCLQAGRVLAVTDVFNTPHLDPEIAKKFLAKSVAAVPLMVGEQKLGAIIVSFHTPHDFTAEEIERAETAGRQVSLALLNFQQGLEIQQRLKESKAMMDIGRALGQSEQTGSEDVLQLVVDAARELIPDAEQSVIHLVDEDENVLVPRAVSGFEQSPYKDAAIDFKMRLGEGVAGQVLLSGQAINVPDVANDSRFVNSHATLQYSSLLVAPVPSGERMLGTISVQSRRTYAFSKMDVNLLNDLSIVAAIAIENTHLIETVQHRLREADALYTISRGLAGSLDPDEVITQAVRLLYENFKYYHVQVYVMEPETNRLVVRRGSGYIGDQLVRRGHFLEPGEGIVGHVAAVGEAFFTNNVDDVVFFRRNELLPNTQAEIAVPIKVGQVVLGVLDIQNMPPNRFTSDDLQLMMTVADQVAVALQKASLHRDLETSLKQEQDIRSQLVQSERLALVGRLLASVSHELNNPLQAIQNALFLLKDETKLSEQSRQDLDVILSETERMAALIERLRSAYRPVRMKDFQPVALNPLIEDVHALISTHMRHKEILFEFLPDPALADASGLADQIRQVVLNLFINAIDAMQPGGRLTVQTANLAEQGEILFSVRDTGPGIPNELREKIFDAFVTSKNTGTGLGLTITHDIIQQHHGRIEADNHPEGGAIFRVWLPVHMRKENAA